MLISAKSVEDCISAGKRDTFTDLQSILQNINKFVAGQTSVQLFTWILLWILWDFSYHLFCITYDKQIQNSCSKKSLKTLEKTPVLESPFNRAAGLRLISFLKRQSSAGVFLLTLGNFQGQLFYRTLLDDCLSNTIQISLH